MGVSVGLGVGVPVSSCGRVFTAGFNRRQTCSRCPRDAWVPGFKPALGAYKEKYRSFDGKWVGNMKWERRRT